MFLIESIAFKTPIFVLDTFENASLLTNNNTNGLLINKKSSAKEIANLVSHYLTNNKMFNKEAFKDFFIKNFSLEVFEKKWFDCIQHLLKKQ